MTDYTANIFLTLNCILILIQLYIQPWTWPELRQTHFTMLKEPLSYTVFINLKIYRMFQQSYKIKQFFNFKTILFMFSPKRCICVLQF